MKIYEFTDNSKLYEAFRKSKYFRKANHIQIKSGRFPDLPRFTKIQNYLLDSLYSIPDMHNPSAFRIYLYLLRQITGYNSRYSIEYHPKRIKSQMNIRNSFYKAIKLLEDKNMIYFTCKDDIKYIGLNPYPDTWITDGKDRIDEIIEKEVNELLEIKEVDLVSISSSSWSSSSSSSKSDFYKYLDDDELLLELEKMN
jgi:hypothetical protein